MIQFRFKISINDVETIVTPVWGDEHQVDSTIESEEVYFRDRISQTFIFLRDDYSLIASGTIETTFIFIIEEDDGSGSGFVETWRGFFTFSDFVDRDDSPGCEKIETNINRLDEYENIIAALNKEFDLIELAPEISRVEFVKQPVFQLYALNFSPTSAFVTNYINGSYWEQPIIDPSPNSLTLQNDYKFEALSYTNESDFIPGSDAGLNPDVSGEYDIDTKTRSDGHYQYRYNSGNLRYEIIDLFDSNTVVYQSDPLGVATQVEGLSIRSPLMTSLVDGTSQIIYYQTLFWGRILCNVDDVNGDSTFDLPDPDLTAPSEIYTKVLPEGDIGIIFWDGHQIDPTPFGKFSSNAANYAGEYHTKPPSATYGEVFPFAPSLWTGFSVWVFFNANMQSVQVDASETKLVNHAYKLPDVISAWLKVVDPNITHLEDTDHSDFYYGNSNPIRGSRKYPLFVPKSNIVVGDYDQPAQTAKFKMINVLELCWGQKVKWFVEDGKFKLEHIQFFHNGKSYTTPGIGADFTVLLEPTTQLSWSYGSNNFAYDKVNIPERFQFNWMDSVSKPFEGVPIEIRSAIADPGNIEQISVSLFTSDLDFIQIQPTDISKDGFVFLEASPKGGDLYFVPFVDVILPDGIQYKLQNGHASFTFIHDNYWNYVMPAPLVTINGEDVTANSVKRSKIQKLELGVIDKPDPMLLITTDLGTGKVRSMQQNLSGKHIDIEIEHDV